MIPERGWEHCIITFFVHGTGSVEQKVSLRLERNTLLWNMRDTFEKEQEHSIIRWCGTEKNVQSVTGTQPTLKNITRTQRARTLYCKTPKMEQEHSFQHLCKIK